MLVLEVHVSALYTCTYMYVHVCSSRIKKRWLRENERNHARLSWTYMYIALKVEIGINSFSALSPPAITKPGRSSNRSVKLHTCIAHQLHVQL